MEGVGIAVILLGVYVTYAGVKDHNPYTLARELLEDPRNFRAILTTPGSWTNTNADDSPASGNAPAATSGGSVPTKDRAGMLADAELQSLSFAPSHRLAIVAANAAEQMNAAYKADTGKNLRVSSSYRTRAQQASVKAKKGSLAASPGNSMHERGLALDLDITNPQTYRWLKDNAGKYNFGQSLSYEKWHWTYGGKESNG
jgi:hypothetical protein